MEGNRAHSHLGGPTFPVAGKFDVREWFAEAQIPIVEENFIDLLQISAGYRYSNYKTEGIDPFSQVVVKNSFNTNTYKLAGEFAPIKDVRFRVAYNRAVRAPNIIELYAPTGLALTGTNDPCIGPTPTFTLAQCINTGVTAAQYGKVRGNAANQYNGVLGGSAVARAGKGRHPDCRCHPSAALRSGAGAYRRLLRHQDQEPDRRTGL